MDHAALAQRIKAWGAELGFQGVGVAAADLSAAEPRLLDWLAKGWHGEMEYMARHGTLRARPDELRPGTLRVISCRMNYANDLPGDLEQDLIPEKALIARYARGRTITRSTARPAASCAIASPPGAIRLPGIHRLGRGVEVSSRRAPAWAGAASRCR
jgi:hypothetical protein